MPGRYLPLPISPWPRWLPILVGGLVVARGLFYLTLGQHPNNGQDFAAYWIAAGLLRAGDPRIYDPLVALRAGIELGIYPAVNAHPYLYPPPLAQALAPLTLLPFTTARLLWLAIGVLLLLSALVVTVAASPPGRRTWIVAIWLTLPYPYLALYLGQADTLVTALLAFVGIALVHGSGRWAAAGIALAGLIKILPGLVGIALLGRPTRAGWLLLTGGVVAIGSLAAAGPANGLTLWLDFAAALPGLSGITRDWVENVSLIATLRRFFLVPPAAPLPVLGGLIVPTRWEPALTLIHAVFAVALLCLILGRFRRLRSGAPRQFTVGWLYSTLILYVLLVAPITWPSALSLLVIPATFVVNWWRPTMRQGQTLAGVVGLGLLWLPSDPTFFSAPWFYGGGFASGLALVSVLRTLALLAFFTLLLSTGATAPAVERAEGRRRLEAARLSA